MPVLDWIGKKAVVNHHRDVPYRLIHCSSKNSVGGGRSEAKNLLIQGDNLEALKALVPYYAGKVKCIYIDPPYNTGNEGWTYSDSVASTEIRNWLGRVVGKEADDLSRHDKWLCMMYPRLRILRDFLREDGFIAISIDENELAHLLNICDDIFKRSNLRVIATRKQKSQSANDNSDFSYKADYVVIFSKSKHAIVRKLPPDPKATAKTHKDPCDDFPLGRWQHVSIRVSSGHQGGGYEYIRKSPDGTPHGGPWICPPETYDQMLQDGRLYFGKDNSSAARRVMYDFESTGTPPDNLWNEVGTNAEGKRELEAIIGKRKFQTPKPSTLVKHILYVCNVEKNDIVMDSFAGSGTTGHAVLDLNNSDGGNRQFILIEMEKNISVEVTAKRLRKVISGYKENGDPNKSVGGLGGGFRYCRLGTPLFNEFGDINETASFSDLAAHIFFSETGTPLEQQADSTTQLIGCYQSKAVYLLFKSSEQGIPHEAVGNVLTPDVLTEIPSLPEGFEGDRVIYAEGCTMDPENLKAERIIFKQIPYQIEGS